MTLSKDSEQRVMNDALVTCDISYRISPTAASTHLKDIENICDEKYGRFRIDTMKAGS